MNLETVYLLEKQIEHYKKELSKLVTINGNNLLHPNVIELSQRIDHLLILYWELTYLNNKKKRK
ncbi:Spo0E like sporulation regulatory protein [Paenibacillus catalpae]|uniref:Spo0E like sporulation regulatory protein n=1 Tax=Paenibacillus catalpae TaxID=1045775 RepID=A0A1I2BTT7_9BACL|nr:aspartyl-phosphate phosphatase Spo0E family protein [Paenibacillus catalpae]SFE59546.1 Spo0E like sporulation regulatory protein [Paenibacillus catalpae]